MNNSKELFLDETYILDGVEITGAEIQENKILREMLQQKNQQPKE